MGVRKVTRAGEARWVIDFRYLDKDGRRKRYRKDASVQTATAAKAEATRLEAFAAAHGVIQNESVSTMTFAAFVESDFQTYMAAKCRPATRERYQALFRQGILRAFGSMRLAEIGAPDFRRYAAELAARGVQGRGPLSLVRTVLRAAVEFGRLEAMPALPKLPKASKKLPAAPTEDEVQAMLLHARGWIRVAIALAAYAGLRQGEVRALEVRDVDLRRGQISVRRSYSADEVLTPKSGDERPVPIAPQLAVILAEAMRGKRGADRVVLNSKGNTPGRQHVLEAFLRLLDRHGLKMWTYHALRHSFCSVLVRHGASLEAVRRLAGHHDLKVTQRYVHATSSDLRDAIRIGLGNGGETARELLN